MTIPRAQIVQFRDARGRKLHLNDGPIDLIIEAFGDAGEVDAAYTAASRRFVTILDELCTELPLLRKPAASDARLSGVVAKRMLDAVMPYAEEAFITPMAAVAGAVAEEILGAMTEAARLARAYVNDGGDIALHLGEGEEFTVGMVERPERPSLFGAAKVRSSDRVRGIATSGWRGRSFSLGIADSVTVLAESAAAADAAATVIANAVDLPGHPGIVRVPARELAPDNDLGERLVTQGVAELSDADIDLALGRGVNTGKSLVRRGLICAAALRLQGETRVLGLPRPDVDASTSLRRLAHA